MSDGLDWKEVESVAAGVGWGLERTGVSTVAGGGQNEVESIGAGKRERHDWETKKKAKAS